MNWNDWKLRLRALRNLRRAECELDEELAFHLEMEARKRNGEVQPQAAARRAFGGLAQIQEQCREIRGLAALEKLARDVRYGLRMLRKSPGFTAVAVLSLAIGIGANTAIFTLVDAVLLRMLPVKHPEQLVVLRWGAAAKSLDISSSYASGWDDRHGFGTNVFSWRIFSEMRSGARTVGSIMGFSPLARISVAANGQAIVTGGMLVSGNYFADLGAETLLGRPITSDDETAAGLPAAVLSYRFWERTFGLDPAVLGKTVTVNGQPCTVIGVTPKSYVGVSSGGLAATPEIDVTLPIRAKERMEAVGRERQDYFGGDLFWIQAMGRRNSQPETTARAELASIIAANLPEAARRDLAADGRCARRRQPLRNGAHSVGGADRRCPAARHRGCALHPHAGEPAFRAARLQREPAGGVRYRSRKKRLR